MDGNNPRKKRVSERVLQRVVYIIRSESGEKLDEREKSRQESCRESHQESSRDSLRESSPQSLGSDYMHGSPQDSLRDSFFTREVPLEYSQ